MLIELEAFGVHVNRQINPFQMENYNVSAEHDAGLMTT